MSEVAETPTRVIRAPRGTTLSCRSWQQEAALRMLMNNLDPEVAERPQDLVVYGGIGKAARNWECFDAIVRELRALGNDETLLVQSGKPVGVFRTHEGAPRVLISNSMLVPHWATWEDFYELDRKGLMMYGQMTAGSWIYIGTQGILQGTYETFAEAARQHFGGSLQGRLVVTAGLGGMGGAQPLAVTMNEGVILAVDVDRHRIERRLETAYLDELSLDLDEALSRARTAQAAGQPLSIGLLGNAADVLPELVRRGVLPDMVTDQTSAHDPAQRVRPQSDELRRRPRPPQERSRPPHGGGPAGHGRARAGHAGPEAAGSGRLRLRQQHPRRGEEGGCTGRLRLPRLRARLHPSPVLRGEGALPLGGALGRPERPRRDRRRGARDLPAGCGAPALDHAGPARGSSPRACPPASAGWATASAREWAWCSTSSCARDA